MNRVGSALRLDFTVQIRNHLYTIGLGVAALVALAVARLVAPDQLPAVVPALMLLVVGGSTLFYVAGLILFERDEGTLSATIVSPLRTSEYLAAKLVSLSALSILEAAVMVGGAMLLMSLSASVPLPNVVLLLVGVAALCALYTLVGVVLVARFASITDFLVPMAGVAAVLQLPFLHFLGWITHPAFLLVPTSGPTMLIRGAYVPLAAWEWLYASAYTAALLAGLAVWAQHAFERHIVARGG